MTTLLRSLALSAVAIGSLSAAPVPLTTADLGVPKYIKIQDFNEGRNIANGGGEFKGLVSTLTPTTLQTSQLPSNPFASSIETKFWCVDSQLYFSFGNEGNEGYANIVGINQLPGLASYVRYGNISANAPANPGWTNRSVVTTGGTLVALPTVAKDRYLMAAYLVSQYTFVGGSLAVGNDNTNIQKAIWSIMNNNTATQDHSGTTGNEGPLGAGIIDNGYTNGGSKTVAGNSIAYWVNRANTEYAKVDQTKWAIVSWLVTSQGSLLGTDGNERPSVDRQTFLVQVVPEPGFYGVLAGGLGILLWGVRRRKTEV